MYSNGATQPQRTLEQISTVLTHAKLKENDFLPTTQVLYLNGKNAKTNQYKLLELDNHLMETLKCNDTIVFKGGKKEKLVLCTETRTYDVREAETSNSLLLVPNLQLKTDLMSPSSDKIISNKNIAGISNKYLELIPSKPKLNKIVNLLEKCVYKGPENEYEYENEKFLSFDELLKISQSSKKELQQILNKMDTAIIDGKIRILELEYHFRVLSYITQSVDENSWSLDEIKKDETMSAWSEIVPIDVLETIFNIYTEKSKVINNDQLYKFNETKLCQFFAKVMLFHAKKFNLNDFLQTWKASVPEGIEAKEKMLSGMAIIDRNAQPNVIWYFPESALPDNISDRFEILFETKKKWSVADITPYIQSLTTDKMDANAMLAKYARASTENGVRHYCAKHCH